MVGGVSERVGTGGVVFFTSSALTGTAVLSQLTRCGASMPWPMEEIHLECHFA